MESLFNTVRDFCLKQPCANTIWLAYSGGLDSHVLLHVLAEVRNNHPFNLHAVYIDHGVQPAASQWAVHCKTICRELAIDFSVHTLSNKSPTQNNSLEDWLRTERYAVFANLMQPNDVLLTAHHQNDQAETVLLQLLRGAGPKGLAAMPRLKSFAAGWHGRPLLDVTRAELQDYAVQHQLQWVEDESNVDTRFARNFLRHEVLPLLSQRWPTVTNTLARTAAHCAEAQALVEFFTEADLQAVQGSVANTLSVKKLLALSVMRQRQALRAWLMALQFPLPSAVKLQQILDTVLTAGDDKMPVHGWQHVELRRYRDNLIAMPCLSLHDATCVVPWNFSASLCVPSIGTLQAMQTVGAGLRKELDDVTVRFRSGGEIVKLPGRQCHHELKKLWQQWGVPPWLRDRIPLIYVREKLAAVVGFCVVEEFLAGVDQVGVEVRLVPLDVI